VLTGVRLELTKAAADALNGSLNTNVFAEGLPFGTATVRADI
jgi:hypothetical protein